LGDALGSVRQLTNVQGNITLAKSYAPYGETLASAESGTSPFAFTGEQQDPSGLTYLRARYYAPGMGRFLTQDTWDGDANKPMSYNMWNYGYSNPILYLDPTGHSPDVPCSEYEEGVAMAEKYVSKTDRNGHIIRDELNTYTAAGIAIQCYGLALDKFANETSGLGIAQITNNETHTAYGEQANPGYGLLCYIIYKKVGNNIENVACSICESRKKLEKGLLPGQNFDDVYHLEPPHDQTNPAWAVLYLRRRIEQVVEQCQGKGVKCDDEDRFIIAGLAQNGPGFNVGTMTDTIKTKYIDPITGEIKWQDWYTNGVITPKTKKEYPKQLKLFYTYITMLRDDGYWLPENLDLNDKDIKWLMSQ